MAPEKTSVESPHLLRKLRLTFGIAVTLGSMIGPGILRTPGSDLPRPYVILGYQWTTEVAIFGSLAFLAGSVLTDTSNSIYAIGVIISSYPVYLIFTSPDQRTSWAPAARFMHILLTTQLEKCEERRNEIVT